MKRFQMLTEADARLLDYGSTRVCSVIGFPLGATTADTKHFETRLAILDGAGEIDMVINVGVLKSGDLRFVERDIGAVTSAYREADAVSKVIIRSGADSVSRGAQGHDGGRGQAHRRASTGVRIV